MRIAITGRSGQVATAMAERTPKGSTLVSISRPEFDLAFPENAKQVFEAAKPDLIVSAAAYTAVDKAESERDSAFQINADGAGAVARAAASLGIPIVHLSTDYVFDGSKAGAWVEGEVTRIGRAVWDVAVVLQPRSARTLARRRVAGGGVCSGTVGAPGRGGGVAGQVHDHLVGQEENLEVVRLGAVETGERERARVAAVAVDRNVQVVPVDTAVVALEQIGRAHV